MTNENKGRRRGIIASTAILLLIGSAVYLTVEMGRNSRLENNLKTEKLNAETLLSEKLKLEKEIVRMKTELNNLQGTNVDLEKAFQSAMQQLESTERNANKTKNLASTIAVLRKQNAELLQVKDELKQELERLDLNNHLLQSSNDDLERTVALLSEDNKTLSSELQAARLGQTNEILVKATTKKDKLNVKAKRTRKLIVEADVPALAENLSFKIINPSGNELTDQEGLITFRTIEKNKKSSRAFYTDEHAASPDQLTYNRIEMICSPKQRLAPGTYKIEVLSNQRSIVSLQVKLK